MTIALLKGLLYFTESFETDSWVPKYWLVSYKNSEQVKIYLEWINKIITSMWNFQALFYLSIHSVSVLHF